jgi:hypothetical protein
VPAAAGLSNAVANAYDTFTLVRGHNASALAAVLYRRSLHNDPSTDRLYRSASVPKRLELSDLQASHAAAIEIQILNVTCVSAAETQGKERYKKKTTQDDGRSKIHLPTGRVMLSKAKHLGLCRWQLDPEVTRNSSLPSE